MKTLNQNIEQLEKEIEDLDETVSQFLNRQEKETKYLQESIFYNSFVKERIPVDQNPILESLILDTNVRSKNFSKESFKENSNMGFESFIDKKKQSGSQNLRKGSEKMSLSGIRLKPIGESFFNSLNANNPLEENSNYKFRARNKNQDLQVNRI